MDPRVSVVIATRNRREELLGTLHRLAALPEQPATIVVDNGSTDDTTAAVAGSCPGVQVITLDRNCGAVARNYGVERATTPYVAFCDDDSWWAPGSLARAADHLDAVPRLAVVAARIVLGAGQDEPLNAVMAASPLPTEPDVPGTPVLGFVSCAAVVRRQAFLDVGGFDELIFFYGEEALVSLDLASAGLALSYLPDVVAHHRPSVTRDRGLRRHLQIRNALLTCWLRRPLPLALRRTTEALVGGCTDAELRRGTAAAFRRLPAALAQRRPIGKTLEARLRLLGNG